MKLRVHMLVLATLAFAGAACAQSYEFTTTPDAGSGAPFQIRYASHLDIGDSVINITNDGYSASGTGTAHFSATGSAISASASIPSI